MAKSNSSMPSLSAIATIVGIASALIGLGWFFGIRRVDMEKMSLEKSNTSLQNTIDRLQSRIKTDSLERRNWMLLDSTHFQFNTIPGGTPTLTVVNASVSQCYLGKATGCWTTSANAMPGDTISFQISYRNTGAIAVQDVSIGFRGQYPPPKRVFYGYGGIMVGNMLVKEEMATVYIGAPATGMLPFKDAVWWIDQKHPKLIDIDGLHSGYYVGTVMPGQQSAIVFNAIVR